MPVVVIGLHLGLPVVVVLACSSSVLPRLACSSSSSAVAGLACSSSSTKCQNLKTTIKPETTDLKNFREAELSLLGGS